eukprot:5476441-Alexandrium_andersonii.AAC.1
MRSGRASATERRRSRPRHHHVPPGKMRGCGCELRRGCKCTARGRAAHTAASRPPAGRLQTSCQA